jgi:hypothetical protein
MYRAVKALLQVATETSGIAALPARLTAFVALIALIDQLDRAQNTPTRGKVGDRNTLIEALIDLTLELSGFAVSYAREHGLKDLEEKVDVSAADFRRLRVTRRPGLAQQVHDAIAPIATQLAAFGITAETLTAHQTAIDAAEAGLSEPRGTVAEKRVATAAMAKAFAEADELLEAHIDPLLFTLRKTHPEFYAEYRIRREVLDRPGQVGAPSESTAAVAGSLSASSTPSAPAQSTNAQVAA